MSTQDQDVWLQRVLGLDLPALKAGSGTTNAPWTAMLPVWRDAKDEIDGTIARLQSALRETGDDDLEQIADAGLYGVTTGQSVRLQAALHDADGDGGTAATRRALIGAVRSYRDYLDGAPIVDLLEDNAWHPVPLRRVLGPALNQIERQAAA